MIELVNVSKYYPTKTGPHYVFRNVSLRLPGNINIGVIGPNGAGKSTFLKLIAGVEPPSSGRIIRTGKISWPMGLTAGLQPTLTGRENARFAARVYGLDAAKIKNQLERIEEIAGIGKYFELPVATYSAGMKQRVSFAITISMDFDYYIFDEVSAGGDLAFQAMAQAMMRDRLAHSRFVLASHNFREIRRLCQAAILIGGGKLAYFDNVEEAIKAYGRRPAEARQPGNDLKVQKLRQQYINLKLHEKRQAAHTAAATDPGKREIVMRRLQNTRDHLLQVTRELRTLRAELPAPAEIDGIDEQLKLIPRPALAARRLLLLRRQIEQLKIDETRQELNARKAQSRAKKADFLGRLAETRRQLAAAEGELDALERQPPARGLRPSQPSRPARPALASNRQ